MSDVQQQVLRAFNEHLSVGNVRAAVRLVLASLPDMATRAYSIVRAGKLGEVSGCFDARESREIQRVLQACGSGLTEGVMALVSPRKPSAASAMFPVVCQGLAGGEVGSLRELKVGSHHPLPRHSPRAGFCEAVARSQEWVASRCHEALAARVRGWTWRLEPDLPCNEGLDGGSAAMAALVAFCSLALRGEVAPEVAFTGLLEGAGERFTPVPAGTLPAKIRALSERAQLDTLFAPGHDPEASASLRLARESRVTLRPEPRILAVLSSVFSLPEGELLATLRPTVTGAAAGGSSLSPAQVQTWLARINESRPSELRVVQGQLYLAVKASVASRPLDLALHDRLSKLLLNDEQFEAALREVDLALQLSPDDPMLQHRRGMALVHLKDHQGARALLDDLFQRNPALREERELANLEARYFREVYQRTGDRAALQRSYELRLQAYERSGRFDHYSGGQAIDTVLDLGDRDAVDALLPEVVALCERMTRAPSAHYWEHFSLGQLRLIQLDPEAALDSYGRGLQGNPPRRDVHAAYQGATHTAEVLGLQIPRISELLAPYAGL